MAQFWWIVLLKKYMGFRGGALCFGTNYSRIANVGPRADPFAPSEVGENGYLLKKKCLGINSKQ